MAQILNSLTPKKQSFSAVINSESYQRLINNTLKDPKVANRFVANIVTAVSNNPALQDCAPATILSAGLLGETLGFTPSAQLGQFYIIPFNDRERGKIAVFQIGYKGYVQLAMRSGYYKKLNVMEIKDGELEYWNPVDEEIKINLIDDDEVRESKETIGYYAMFEYLNGFVKPMYWSKKKMQSHALKYSQGYKKDLEKGTQYTFWAKAFDEMAKKTMLRQLISKWGIMSIEMQEAYTKDEAFIKEDGTPEYVDIPSDEPLHADEPKEEPLQADEPITPQEEVKETKKTKEPKEPNEKQVYTPKVTFDEARKVETEEVKDDYEEYQEQRLDLEI